MKITIDDWHFRPAEADTLVIDAFLGNGQHALLEVYPMKNPNAPNGQIPEIISFCELPGEKLTSQNCVSRWVTRPPDRSCPWSNIELAPALLQQIRQRFGYVELSQPPVAA